MLAHVNTTGQHVALWIDSDVAGWGQSADYSYQEGSFFGNIFVSPPKAYFCNGRDFDLGVVAGRLGANQSGSPYTSPYYNNYAQCQTYCSAHGTDGFNSCPVYSPAATFKHITTVWRNFDSTTQYKVCNKMNSMCLDVSGGSTADEAALIQSPYNGAKSQKWNIIKTTTGKYKLTNVNSGRALALANGATADGTALIQTTFTSAGSQIWYITSMPENPGFYKLLSTAASTAAATCPQATVSTSGAAVQVALFGGADTQKWTVSVAN